MNKRIICITLLSSIALLGCGSKSDVTDKNLGSAITAYYEKSAPLCIRFDKPVIDVTQAQLAEQKENPTGSAGQMEALAAAGLFSEKDTSVEELTSTSQKPNSSAGKQVIVKRYTLTETGKKFYTEKGIAQSSADQTKQETQGNICFGKVALDKIIKWDSPATFGNYQETHVYFLYKIDGLQDWATKPEVLAAYPKLRQIIEGASKRELSTQVKLTNLGWEVVPNVDEAIRRDRDERLRASVKAMH